MELEDDELFESLDTDSLPVLFHSDSASDDSYNFNRLGSPSTHRRL